LKDEEYKAVDEDKEYCDNRWVLLADFSGQWDDEHGSPACRYLSQKSMALYRKRGPIQYFTGINCAMTGKMMAGLTGDKAFSGD
jgi:hypothetical protein